MVDPTLPPLAPELAIAIRRDATTSTACVGGCGRGVCDRVHSRCNCQAGWGGARCDTLLRPACSLGEQPEPQIRISCAGLRKISPVACECLLECLADGEEVCGHASFGCNDNWRTGTPTARRTESWNLTNAAGFFAALTCVAFPPGVAVSSSSFPLPRGGVITTLPAYRSRGGAAHGLGRLPASGRVPAYGAGKSAATSAMPEDVRAGGLEPRFAPGAEWVEPWWCGPVGQEGARMSVGSGRRGCSGRGRCLLEGGEARCVCVDGSHGTHCEQVCANDCLHDCSGRGACVHGFCACDENWFGVDCSDTLAPHLVPFPRADMHYQAGAYGPGPVGSSRAQLRSLPPPLRAHVLRLRRSIFVYDLPPSINREGDMWATRYWEGGSFLECDPVHTRRIYASQTHFDGHLLHDDFVRTLDPSEAKLFYVPTFVMQRHTWGGTGVHRSLLMALEHIRHAYPYWNASAGRDHVWFLPGEKQTCDSPAEILAASIVLGHWGGQKGFTTFPSDCVDAAKDVVVPPITPIQHDLPTFERRLAGPMRHATAHPRPTRNGSLLLFAGGIMSFGASQDRVREGGVDTAQKQARLQSQAESEPCAEPDRILDHRCRSQYSMGVRAAIWRQKLYLDPEMKIVSSGIPDYLETAAAARFCLHTEGNSWGTRLIDQMVSRRRHNRSHSRCRSSSRLN